MDSINQNQGRMLEAITSVNHRFFSILKYWTQESRSYERFGQSVIVVENHAIKLLDESHEKYLKLYEKTKTDKDLQVTSLRSEKEIWEFSQKRITKENEELAKHNEEFQKKIFQLESDIKESSSKTEKWIRKFQIVEDEFKKVTEEKNKIQTENDDLRKNISNLEHEITDVKKIVTACTSLIGTRDFTEEIKKLQSSFDVKVAEIRREASDRVNSQIRSVSVQYYTKYEELMRTTQEETKLKLKEKLESYKITCDKQYRNQKSLHAEEIEKLKTEYSMKEKILQEQIQTLIVEKEEMQTKHREEIISVKENELELELKLTETYEYKSKEIVPILKCGDNITICVDFLGSECGGMDLQITIYRIYVHYLEYLIGFSNEGLDIENLIKEIMERNSLPSDVFEQLTHVSEQMRPIQFTPTESHDGTDDESPSFKTKETPEELMCG